jgi:hypothetical protein
LHHPIYYTNNTDVGTKQIQIVIDGESHVSLTILYMEVILVSRNGNIPARKGEKGM